MIYLLNSFPNSLQPTEGQAIKISGISTEDAQDYGAIFVSRERFAIALAKAKECGSLTYSQIVES